MNTLKASTFIGVCCYLTSLQVHAISTDVVCSYAPSQSPLIAKITGTLGGAGVGVEAIMSAAGLSAVTHSSGGYILTSAGGYIAGTLGGAIAVPVLVTVSVLTSAGTIAVELTCAPKNHPQAVARVKATIDSYTAKLQALQGTLDPFQKAAIEKMRLLNQGGVKVTNKAIDDANEIVIGYRDLALGYFNK